MEEKKRTDISIFIDEINPKLDVNQTVSLFNAMKQYCPYTIKEITKKLNGNKILLGKSEKRKWYTYIINYLTKKEILEVDQREETQTFHKVNEDYQKYFTNQTSTLYSLDNAEKHLMLYEQTVTDFLKKAELINKDKIDFCKKEKEHKKKTELTENEKRNCKYIGGIIIILSILQFARMVSIFGIENFKTIAINSIIFTIGCLILTLE